MKDFRFTISRGGGPIVNIPEDEFFFGVARGYGIAHMRERALPAWLYLVGKP